MCASKLFWGRRGTMIIGALITMAFFFAYTAVRSASQNLGFNCAISFCLNIYYGTLYAYTPEVLPSAHRGTGNGVAIAFNRVMGIMSAVVATFADVSIRPDDLSSDCKGRFIDANLQFSRRVRRCLSTSVLRFIWSWLWLLPSSHSSLTDLEVPRARLSQQSYQHFERPAIRVHFKYIAILRYPRIYPTYSESSSNHP